MNTRERKREREWKPPLPFETAAGSGCGATLPVIARSTRPQLKHIIMVHHQKNIKDEASIASSLILDRCHLCHFCISESIAFGFDFNWGARSGPAALLFPFHLLRFSMYPLIITLTHTHTHTYIYIYYIHEYIFSFCFLKKRNFDQINKQTKGCGNNRRPENVLLAVWWTSVFGRPLTHCIFFYICISFDFPEKKKMFFIHRSFHCSSSPSCFVSHRGSFSCFSWNEREMEGRDRHEEPRWPADGGRR